MSAEDRLRQLAQAATPGPWEVGDWWHIQGARHCQCTDGPPVWTGVRDINGEQMEAHVHRRAEPIGGDIMQAVADEGDPWCVTIGNDYGPATGPEDAAYIAAASPDVVLGLLDRLERAEAERDRLAGAVGRVKALDQGHSDPCRFPDVDCVCSVPLFDLRAALDGADDERGK